MRFDTVLFELEGVLADTAALRRDSLRRSLAEDGLTFTDAEWDACGAGATPRDAAAALAHRRGALLDDVALDLAALRAERHFAAASGRGLSLAPGARELVEALAPHARLGVVTRAARRDVDLVLGLAGLEPLVEVLVTGDDPVAPKPDPASYERALARLARRRPVSRDAVLALEDGGAGIRSATAAGLTCVAVGPVPAHEALLAAGALPSLADVTPERLARVAGTTTEGAR
jgi:HAD superfamily hydrolase (TIGR01509 family)